MKTPTNQHTPSLALIGLSAHIQLDLLQALQSLGISATCFEQMPEKNALTDVSYIFSSAGNAIELAKRFHNGKHVIGIFDTNDRAGILSFFSNHGAAALRFPWRKSELAQQMRIIFNLNALLDVQS